MRAALRAVSWIGAYILVVAFPLLVLLVAPARPGAGLWWDFSMALGFAGLAIMGVQFALTARFRRATAPYGIDVIYQFHRWVAIGGFALLCTHYAVLKVAFPASLGPAAPTRAPFHMTAGRVALFLFAVVIVTSLWRKKLRFEYDHWRVLHGVVSTVAVVLAAVHIQGVGYYTSAPSKQALWGGYTVFWVLLIGYVRVLRPLRTLKRPYRVAGVQRERGSTWTLTFEPEGHPGMAFSPGQFAWLSLGRSPFRFKEHPFSFSGSSEGAGSLQITIKELGDFTRTVGDTPVGSRAYLDGPYGVFTVDRYPSAPGFVFIAGGSGIAPIMSMLRTLADRRDARPLDLIYGSASWEGVTYREELEALPSRLDLRVVHVLMDPPPDWTGERGLITKEVLQRSLREGYSAFQYFLCGPQPMSENVQEALHELGVPLRRVHFEIFNMV